MIPRKPPIRKFPDGREVCAATAAGCREYRRRVSAMRERQNDLCCLCGTWLGEADTTFEHPERTRRRKAGRPDRSGRQMDQRSGALLVQ